MVDIDYPPSRTIAFGDALDDLEQRVATLDENDAEHRVARNKRDGLQWAVEVFGADAAVEIRAYTATTRARVLDELRTGVVGDPGPEQRALWLTAAGISDAPWYDGDEDLATRADIVGQLPPALVDWLDDQLDSINDLGDEGN
jgi:hypothetical protein